MSEAFLFFPSRHLISHIPYMYRHFQLSNFPVFKISQYFLPPSSTALQTPPPCTQTISGFAPSAAKLLATAALVVLTGGLFLILLTWRSDIKLNCIQRRVPLDRARKVLLKDKFGQIFEEDVVVAARAPFFVNKKIKYVWDAEVGAFVKLTNIDEGMMQGAFHRCKVGRTNVLTDM